MAKSRGELNDDNQGAPDLEDITHDLCYLYGYDNIGNIWRRVRAEEDGRLITKTSLTSPEPPPATTRQVISADPPLIITSGVPAIKDFTIPDGEVFTVQSITYGSEGDPNERGNRVEVLYVDFLLVEHVITRLYMSSFSSQVFPDTNIARDGTSLLGNSIPGQGLIRIIRQRLGGGSSEVDVVVRGYTS